MGTEGKENRMEVTTKKQNRRKIVIGVLIAVVVLVAAVIAYQKISAKKHGGPVVTA